MKKIIRLLLALILMSASYCHAVQSPKNMKSLDNRFLPLQKNQIFYSDWKFKNRLSFIEARDLVRFKANFGKKVWTGSHTMRDVKKASDLLGDLLGSKRYSMSAMEIGKEVGPFLEDYWHDVDFDGKAIMKAEKEDWADRFELWGRSFVDLNRMGKQRCTFKLEDYENGNFLMIKPKKGSQWMAWYIPEKYDALVKGLLKYETRIERSKSKKDTK
jgi:hypothetical protein